MPSAADDVAAAVRVAGPIRFDTFLELALYGPNGFYNGSGSAGRRGDFLTSPEVGPLFGAVLARYIVHEHQRLGSPDRLTIVDAGAGPGTLARSLCSALARALDGVDVRVVAVEVSAAQRARHPDGVTSMAELPAGPWTGVIVANELLDNLPFRLVVFDGGWQEAHVDVRDGRCVEVLRPLHEGVSWLPERAPHGARVPVQGQAADWVRAAAGSLAAGSVVAFDYVTPSTAALADMPWRDWLRTYRGHQRGSHYLSDVGMQDVTAQVALDQLPSPTDHVTQAAFLTRWGIADLVDEGRRVWAEHAHAPTVAALGMRSRVREAEALLDPAGLGGFSAMRWTVEPT